MSRALKVAVVGPPNSGKSSLVRRATSDSFDSVYNETAGFDSHQTELVDTTGITSNLLVTFFECGGAALSKPQTPYVYSSHSSIATTDALSDAVDKRWMRVSESTTAFLLCYDITSVASYNAVVEYYYNCTLRFCPGAFSMLIGCKADLEPHRAVPVTKAEGFASKHNLFFMETSAADGTNVDLTMTILRIRAAHALMKGIAPQLGAQALDVTPVAAPTVVVGTETPVKSQQQQQNSLLNTAALTTGPSSHHTPPMSKEALDTIAALTGQVKSAAVSRHEPERATGGESALQSPAVSAVNHNKDASLTSSASTMHAVDARIMSNGFRVPNLAGGPTYSQPQAPVATVNLSDLVSPERNITETRPHHADSSRTRTSGEDERMLHHIPHQAPAVASPWSTYTQSGVRDREAGSGVSVDLAEEQGGDHRHGRRTSHELGPLQHTARELDPKDPRRVLFTIDVKLAGKYVGPLDVRRADNPFSLAQKFVQRYRLEPSNLVKLAKVVETRTRSFLQEEEVADAAEKRRQLQQEIQVYRYKRTIPKPFQLLTSSMGSGEAAETSTHAGQRHVTRGRGASAGHRAHDHDADSVASSRETSRSRRPAVIGRIHVQLAHGRVGKIAIRENDDVHTLVRNFTKTYGLRDDRLIADLLREVSAHVTEARRQAVVNAGSPDTAGVRDSVLGRRDSIATDRSVATHQTAPYEAVVPLVPADAKPSVRRTVVSPPRGPTMPIVSPHATYLQPTQSYASRQGGGGNSNTDPWSRLRSVSPDALRGIEAARQRRQRMDVQQQEEAAELYRRHFSKASDSPNKYKHVQPTYSFSGRSSPSGFTHGSPYSPAAPATNSFFVPANTARSTASAYPSAQAATDAPQQPFTAIDEDESVPQERAESPFVEPAVLEASSAVPLQELTQQQKRLLATTLARSKSGPTPTASASVTPQQTPPPQPQQATVVQWPSTTPSAVSAAEASKPAPEKQTTALFNMDVDIGGGNTARIVVYEDSDMHALASEFVSSHGLPPTLIPRVEQLIIASKRKHSKQAADAKPDLLTREFR